MARIPEQRIQRTREEISVERLVIDSGVSHKKGGKDWIGKCPLQADDAASLVVTPAKNLWHCFGCGLGGGPFDWMMGRRGVSFRHAVELLREGLPASSLAAGVDGGKWLDMLPGSGGFRVIDRSTYAPLLQTSGALSEATGAAWEPLVSK